MYSPFYILYLAMIVSSLTYTIGALFYGSPIPIYSFKRLGRKMITDAIYVAVWINIFDFVINLINQIQSILGANWNAFYLDMGFLQLQLIYNINGLKLLYAIISAVISYLRVPSFLANFIVPILDYISFLTDVLLILIFYTQLGIFIQNYYIILIAIGLLLMSFPFRMGRGIGSLLISSAIVFYIGYPLLPILISSSGGSQYQNILLQNLSLAVAEISGDIPLLIYAYIIVPIVYISILAGFSIVLENFLGGNIGKLPFPLEIG